MRNYTSLTEGGEYPELHRIESHKTIVLKFAVEFRSSEGRGVISAFSWGAKFFLNFSMLPDY